MIFRRNRCDANLHLIFCSISWFSRNADYQNCAENDACPYRVHSRWFETKQNERKSKHNSRCISESIVCRFHFRFSTNYSLRRNWKCMYKCCPMSVLNRLHACRERKKRVKNQIDTMERKMKSNKKFFHCEPGQEKKKRNGHNNDDESEHTAAAARS